MQRDKQRNFKLDKSEIPNLDVLQSLLEIVVVGPDCPPQPVEGVLHVPLDDLPALGRSAANLHQLLGGLAVLGKLLPGFACNCEPRTRQSAYPKNLSGAYLLYFNYLRIQTLSSRA